MIIYFNNFENRQATPCEINLYKQIDIIMNNIDCDDFIYTMDTLKGYCDNNPFYDYDDIIDLSIRFDTSTSALLLYYHIETIEY